MLLYNPIRLADAASAGSLGAALACNLSSGMMLMVFGLTITDLPPAVTVVSPVNPITVRLPPAAAVKKADPVDESCTPLTSKRAVSPLGELTSSPFGVSVQSAGAALSSEID